MKPEISNETGISDPSPSRFIVIYGKSKVKSINTEGCSKSSLLAALHSKFGNDVEQVKSVEFHPKSEHFSRRFISTRILILFQRSVYHNARRFHLLATTSCQFSGQEKQILHAKSIFHQQTELYRFELQQRLGPSHFRGSYCNGKLESYNISGQLQWLYHWWCFKYLCCGKNYGQSHS